MGVVFGVITIGMERAVHLNLLYLYQNNIQSLLIFLWKIDLHFKE
jgi:hypothetical protein